MTPLWALPPGVSARTPGGTGAGTAACEPVAGWLGVISAGAVGEAAGGTVCPCAAATASRTVRPASTAQTGDGLD